MAVGIGAARPNRLGRPAGDLLLAIGAAVVALAARLIPLLRGGGLTGLGNFDDGVYFASGTALLHGLLPYRDFLFLHPPGILVLLAPFGLAGGDPAGLAAARLAWLLLGVVNTVLVARILRPLGLLEAATGAFLYATAYPAVYVEWTPLLEGPAQTCVLGAVLILTRAEERGGPTTRASLLAGALLGFSATMKIWGVAAILAVLLWCSISRRGRAALQLGIGAAAAVGVICPSSRVGPPWPGISQGLPLVPSL